MPKTWSVTLATVLLAACGSETPAPSTGSPDVRQGEGLTLAVTTTDVRTGGDLAFRFTNGSDDTVTTGVLDCVNHYERRDGDRWVPLESFRMCIEIAETHAPGSARSYTTPAPDSPGHYRLVIEAWAADEMVARSAPFEVRP